MPTINETFPYKEAYEPAQFYGVYQPVPYTKTIGFQFINEKFKLSG